jgi:8-oxo-dGTP pyrophosphatase MutT (NUDIX family)
MLERLRAAGDFDPAGFIPLLQGGKRVGWLRPAFAAALEAHPLAFRRTPAGVAIIDEKALDPVVEKLAADGWISGWRDERYPVLQGPGAAVLFELERASFRRFGLLARASHLNGWTRSTGGWKLWIARRSPRKPIDPGMLDNLVGGGIAAGSTPEATLLKECAEEAGIPAALAGQAVAAGTMRVQRAVDAGLHDELIHAFDLEVPEGFVPVNQDGEVAAFMLLDAEAVVARLAAGEFTADAGAVTADFLWRKGALTDPAIGEALAALRAAAEPS